MAKFRIPALLFLIAPVFCAAALMSLAPGGRAGAAADPGTGAIADAEGTLKSPRTIGRSTSISGPGRSPPTTARDRSSCMTSMRRPAPSPLFGLTATFPTAPFW